MGYLNRALACTGEYPLYAVMTEDLEVGVHKATQILYESHRDGSLTSLPSRRV
jgi:hypothetical protein